MVFVITQWLMGSCIFLQAVLLCKELENKGITTLKLGRSYIATKSNYINCYPQCVFADYFAQNEIIWLSTVMW